MHRVMSAVLFFCIGALASLQAAPFQRCLLQNQIILSGAGSGLEEVQGCCDACEDEHLLKEHSNEKQDCCVDLEKLPEAAVPSHLERVPEPIMVLALVLFVPYTWELVMKPAANQQDYPPVPPEMSFAPGRRQAELRVWTV